MKLNRLTTKYVGRNLIYHEVIDSTQLEAWRLVNKNISNGSIVIANLQTGGIGTHGRIWYTDVKENIAFSIILYPNCNVSKLCDITLNIAEIIVGIFLSIYGIKMEIKHPNDIIYNDKKIGGILVETKLCGEFVKSLVIGIGINLNQENFNDNISEIATSIKKEFGIDVDKDRVIAEICNKLEKSIENF